MISGKIWMLNWEKKYTQNQAETNLKPSHFTPLDISFEYNEPTTVESSESWNPLKFKTSIYSSLI